MPVTGMMPIVMPMFSKQLKEKKMNTPRQRTRPIVSLAFLPIMNIRNATKASRVIIRLEPMKPSCSPIAVKMKSVRCSGT